MKFLEVELFTNSLEKQKVFYRDKLSLEITENINSFSVQIGWTKLTFTFSELAYKYHYCFLIPSNHLLKAIEWTKNRFFLVDVDGSLIVNQSPSWNAQSIYFYDGNGNIAEFIVRHNLKNESDQVFDENQIICFNEIGLCSSDNSYPIKILESNLGISTYSGNVERFASQGDEEGLFLLINQTKKDRWFPTDVPTESSPFSCSIEHNKIKKTLGFKDGQLSVED